MRGAAADAIIPCFPGRRCEGSIGEGSEWLGIGIEVAKEARGSDGMKYLLPPNISNREGIVSPMTFSLVCIRFLFRRLGQLRSPFNGR